jgi:hypothetical protein
VVPGSGLKYPPRRSFVHHIAVAAPLYNDSLITSGFFLLNQIFILSKSKAVIRAHKLAALLVLIRINVHGACFIALLLKNAVDGVLIFHIHTPA